MKRQRKISERWRYRHSFICFTLKLLVEVSMLGPAVVTPRPTRWGSSEATRAVELGCVVVNDFTMQSNLDREQASHHYPGVQECGFRSNATWLLTEGEPCSATRESLSRQLKHISDPGLVNASHEINKNENVKSIVVDGRQGIGCRLVDSDEQSLKLKTC